MAAFDFIGHRLHALRQEAFQLGLDSAVPGGNDVPARLRPPRRALNFLVEQVRSRQLSAAVVERLRKITPGLEVIYRDLTAEPLAHFVSPPDRKSTRLNSSHRCISYDVFC